MPDLHVHMYTCTVIAFSHCHLCKCKRRLAASIYFSDQAYLLFPFTFMQDASARLAASKFLQACFESFALARVHTAVLRIRNSGIVYKVINLSGSRKLKNWPYMSKSSLVMFQCERKFASIILHASLALASCSFSCYSVKTL